MGRAVVKYQIVADVAVAASEASGQNPERRTIFLLLCPSEGKEGRRRYLILSRLYFIFFFFFWTVIITRKRVSESPTCLNSKSRLGRRTKEKSSCLLQPFLSLPPITPHEPISNPKSRLSLTFSPFWTNHLPCFVSLSLSLPVILSPISVHDLLPSFLPFTIRWRDSLMIILLHLTFRFHDFPFFLLFLPDPHSARLHNNIHSTFRSFGGMRNKSWMKVKHRV